MYDEEIKIESRDYWLKVVDFLQQNWALIDAGENGNLIVYFFGDTSGVFDQLEFNSVREAETALRRSGFTLYDKDVKAQEFVAKPNLPFHSANHPNGLIYSSGKFWR